MGTTSGSGSCWASEGDSAAAGRVDAPMVQAEWVPEAQDQGIDHTEMKRSVVNEVKSYEQQESAH